MVLNPDEEERLRGAIAQREVQQATPPKLDPRTLAVLGIRGFRPSGAGLWMKEVVHPERQKGKRVRIFFDARRGSALTHAPRAEVEWVVYAYCDDKSFDARPEGEAEERILRAMMDPNQKRFF